MKFHGKLINKKTFSKKLFHEIPGWTSRNIHGIFLDLELRKLSFGTFYSGLNTFSILFALKNAKSYYDSGAWPWRDQFFTASSQRPWASMSVLTKNDRPWASYQKRPSMSVLTKMTVYERPTKNDRPGASFQKYTPMIVLTKISVHERLY